MAQRTYEELAHDLAHAATLVEMGGRYAHFKHPEHAYVVTGFVILETSEEVAVLYETETEPRVTFARPLASFCAHVEHEGRLVPRFTRLG